MANIHDVAKRAGVSATTAKRAIREPHKLAPDTLRRVRDAIDALPDAYPWMGLVTPGIDSLAQPVAPMGRAAVRPLFEQIGREADAEVQRLRFPAEPLVRGSVVAPALEATP